MLTMMLNAGDFQKSAHIIITEVMPWQAGWYLKVLFTWGGGIFPVSTLLFLTALTTSFWREV